MRGHREPLSLPVQRAAWDALWDKLLRPPRREPAEPEPIPRPEDTADPGPRSRGEGGRP